MKQQYHSIQNRQSGMVSHLLLFIVLIMLANAAIFAPNIAALKDNRQAIEKISDEKLLNLLASSIARASSLRMSGDMMPLDSVTPPASLKHDGGVMEMPLSAMSDEAYTRGGRLPSNIRDIAPVRPASLREYMRYCPYYLVEDGHNSANGFISTLSQPPIQFTIIINKTNVLADMVSCAEAAAGVTKPWSKYINVTPAQAIAMIRSSQTEISTFEESACPPGEEMVFVAGETQNTPSSFECQRNILGLASMPTGGDDENCASGTALNSRGAETNGISCADIEIREARVNTQTYDNVNRQIVSMYMVDEYYDAVSPVDSAGNWPNPILPADIMTRLANFECPQRYYDDHPYYPGTRSKGVIILRDGTLICAGGWSLLNTRPPGGSDGALPCPAGKKIVWDAVTSDSNSFVCEGVNANDATYGRWIERCSLSGDGPLTQQVVGYSPNTNRFYCYLSSNANQGNSGSYLYTYPERSPTNCATNGIVTILDNVADCSISYPNRLHTNIRGLANYHDNWAYNWDPTTKTLVVVDPGAYTMGPAAAPSANAAAPDVEAIPSNCDPDLPMQTCNVNDAAPTGID